MQMLRPVKTSPRPGSAMSPPPGAAPLATCYDAASPLVDAGIYPFNISRELGSYEFASGCSLLENIQTPRTGIV